MTARQGARKAATADPGDDLIRALAIKGSAPLESLAPAVLKSPKDTQPMLDRLVKQGVVERAQGAFRLTRDGKTKGRALLKADRGRWGAASAMAALEAFYPFDQRVKETVTAWQLREIGGEQVLNDHSDPIYDRRVLGRLTELHGDISDWLSSLKGAPATIDQYRTRLARALQAARADQHFIASPAVDSYHGVWFELHEALILLAGRSRAEESAAGRA
jgi:hypothetical protein